MGQVSSKFALEKKKHLLRCSGVTSKVLSSLYFNSLRKIYNHAYILVGTMKQIHPKLQSKGKYSESLISWSEARGKRNNSHRSFPEAAHSKAWVKINLANLNAYDHQMEHATWGRGEVRGCGDVYSLAKTFLQTQSQVGRSEGRGKDFPSSHPSQLITLTRSLSQRLRLDFKGPDTFTAMSHSWSYAS